MPKKYQSFAQQFHLEEASLSQRLGRDLRLLRWMIQTVKTWWKGRSIRVEFERCRATQQPFFVDRFAGPPAGPNDHASHSSSPTDKANNGKNAASQSPSSSAGQTGD